MQLQLIFSTLLAASAMVAAMPSEKFETRLIQRDSPLDARGLQKCACNAKQKAAKKGDCIVDPYVPNVGCCCIQVERDNSSLCYCPA